MIEVLKVIGITIIELASALLGAAFTVKDSVDSAQDSITAAIFGVPVLVVTIIGTVLTIGGIIAAIIVWWNKKR